MSIRLLLVPLAALLLGAEAPDSGAAGRIRADVSFLAADRLEGRASGSAGYAIAADYVARRFAAAGLKPGGINGGWYLPVPFRTAYNVGRPTASLIVNGRKIALDPADIGVQPSLTEKARAIDAPLVFVGHGISEPAIGIDEYAGLDVRGKIVVVLPGVPAGLDRDIAVHVREAKQRTALAKGAAGLAQLSFGSFNPALGYAERPLTHWVDSKGATGDDGLRFAVTLSPRAGRALFKRAPRSFDQVGADGAVAVRGFGLAARLTIRADSRWEEFRSPEVVGVLPGSDPRLTAEHIVMMAHLDHLGRRAGTLPGEDAIYNGALDNAAGVATLIETARSFAASGKKPRRSILFLANSGEELGLIGADFYAAHPTVPIRSIVGVVDLDMPLLTYDFSDFVAHGAGHSTIAAAVAAAGRAMGVAVAADPMPQEGLFVRSDHYRFVLRGVPAVFLMTGFANGGREAWSRYLTTNYHQPSDDLSLPIRWAAGARFAELNYRIARALADSAEPPRWNAGDFFGERFAKTH